MAGRGGWIAVTGPVGIGKTCLLEQVVTDVAAAGWNVLSTRGPRVRPGHSLVLGLLDGLDPQTHPLDGPARALQDLPRRRLADRHNEAVLAALEVERARA